MEKLIEDLITKINKRVKHDEAHILENKIENNEKVIVFLSGKIAAFNMCIDELNRLLNYNKGL